MPGEKREKNPFLEVFEETSLAAAIVIGHGVIAIIAILMAAGIHSAIKLLQSGDHEFKIYGVSFRYIVEGAEIVSALVVLGMGIISTMVILTTRLRKSLKE